MENWSQYNEKLVRRGEIIMSFDVIENWSQYNEKLVRRGEIIMSFDD